MIRTVIRICLLCFVIFFGNGEKVTDRRNFGRVIGPPVTADEEQLFSYQVMILENCGKACGGTLISDRVVITAAHCFHGINPNILMVRVGLNEDQHIQNIPIFSYKIHIGFTTSILKNDIAALILKKKVDLSGIQIAELPQYNQLFDGEIAYASGWGGSQILTYTKFKIGHNPGCDHESHLCGDPAISGTRAYKGDSGGPLVIRTGSKFILIGIISGLRKGKNQVFTNVASMTPWIKMVLAETDYLSSFIDNHVHLVNATLC